MEPDESESSATKLIQELKKGNVCLKPVERRGNHAPERHNENQIDSLVAELKGGIRLRSTRRSASGRMLLQP